MFDVPLITSCMRFSPLARVAHFAIIGGIEYSIIHLILRVACFVRLSGLSITPISLTMSGLECDYSQRWKIIRAPETSKYKYMYAHVHA